MYKNRNVLIIKSEANSFEQYYSNHIRENGVDVYSAFPRDSHYGIWTMRFIKLVDRCIPVMQFYFNANWWKRIKEYTDVIIFDSNASVSLVRRIKKANPRITIRLWMWNIRRDFPVEYYKYCLVYSFDEEFCKKNPKCVYINQFYFSPHGIIDNNRIQVFFVGILKGREKQLEAISNQLRIVNINHLFYVYGNEISIESEHVVKIQDYMDYSDVIKRINDSSCVLELVQKGQVGLTVRSLEALFYGKKLITNNEYILNHKFYDSNNIFIWGKDDISGLKSFLASPYKPIKTEIKQEYLFDNWYSQILEG